MVGVQKVGLETHKPLHRFRTQRKAHGKVAAVEILNRRHAFHRALDASGRG
jgi:hypothetical protein